MVLTRCDLALERMDKELMLASVILLQALICWMDHIVSPLVSFATYYFVPIAISAWYLGDKRTYLLVLASSIAGTHALGESFPASGASILVYDFIFKALGFIILSYFVLHVRQLVSRLKEQNHTDYLTVANSRRYFYEASSMELARSYRHKYPVTLAFIDLDNFKEVNDTQGHDTGDQLLMRIADTMKSDLRDGDILGRLGGDEFAILLPQTNADQVKIIIRRMKKNLHNAVAPFNSSVTFSIGVVTYLADKPASIDALIAAADRTMYSVKKSTKNDIQFLEFTETSQEKINEASKHRSGNWGQALPTSGGMAAQGYACKQT